MIDIKNSVEMKLGGGKVLWWRHGVMWCWKTNSRTQKESAIKANGWLDRWLRLVDNASGKQRVCCEISMGIAGNGNQLLFYAIQKQFMAKSRFSQNFDDAVAIPLLPADDCFHR